MAYRRKTYARRAPRRRLMWARDCGSSLFGDASPDARVRNLLQPYETLVGGDVEGTTITRIRGRIRVQPFTAFTGPVLFTAGIKVDDTETQGVIDPDEVVSMTPAARPGFDWMWVHNRHMDGILAQGGETDDVQDRAAVDFMSKTFDLDIKAQRRFDEVQQSLYAYWGFNDTLDTNTTMPDSAIVQWDLHVLLKRP